MKNNTSNDLHHLQRVLLDMIKEIDALCRKHGIRYYLNGGNALGAIRHNGFIPWDDDFDIMMLHDDYTRFLNICRSELDPQKWYIQEGWKDWPGCFTKLRLRGTYFKDIGEWKGIPENKRGIYIDIFEIVNSPAKVFPKRIQYVAAKLLNSFSLTQKGYSTDSLLKKTALVLSRPLAWKPLHRIVSNLVFRYSKKDTAFVGNFFGMSRFRNAFYHKKMFDEPSYHIYEDTSLPLPSDPEAYLRQTFGDYMQLPPEDKRRPLHSLEIDFGNY